MKTLRPLKRSVSPFGFKPQPQGPFDALKDTFDSLFPDASPQKKPKMKVWDDAAAIPQLIEANYKAASNEPRGLIELCTFLQEYWTQLTEHKVADAVYEAMKLVFHQKTEVFLIDHHDKETCEKEERPDKYKDFVLFAKERDTLVTEFFSPINETTPDRYDTFINDWVGSASPDRLLHFLDFCSGSENPTLEYNLVFSRPIMKKTMKNKKLLRSLLDKSRTLLDKCGSSTWETDLETSLDI